MQELVHDMKPVFTEPLLAEADKADIERRALAGFEYLLFFPAEQGKLSLPKDDQLALVQLWVEIVDPKYAQVFLKGGQRKDLFWNSLKMTLEHCSTSTITFDRQDMTASDHLFQQGKQSTLFCVGLDCQLPTEFGITLELDQVPIDVQVNFLCKYRINFEPRLRQSLTLCRSHELHKEVEEFVLEQCKFSFSNPEKIASLELLDGEKTVIRVSQIALLTNQLDLDHIDLRGLKLRIKQQVFPDRVLPADLAQFQTQQPKNRLQIRTKLDLFFE